jgi:uncharacterized protein YegJ (DUF2314 family)
MRKFMSLLAGIVQILGGCQRPATDAGNQGSSLVVAVPTEDSAMEAATREARDSLDRFTGPLSHPGPGQSDFSVKVPVPDGDMTHDIWLQQITFDGSSFSGVLGPDAAEMKSHSPGERVKIAAREISDWMYVDNEKLVGGFNLRAIRKHLSGEARRQFEKSRWFKFE